MRATSRLPCGHHRSLCHSALRNRQMGEVFPLDCRFLGIDGLGWFAHLHIQQGNSPDATKVLVDGFNERRLPYFLCREKPGRSQLCDYPLSATLHNSSTSTDFSRKIQNGQFRLCDVLIHLFIYLSRKYRLSVH
ncbi:hypothetical protein PMAYCL1PPCAC_22837, partial [Pristionchus mayeri]